MNDIVKRLREGTQGTDFTKTDVALEHIMFSAADEIERLRAALREIADIEYEFKVGSAPTPQRIAREALGDD